SIGSLVATDLSHALAEDGVELHPVAVTVDDRMAEARPDLRRCQVPVRAHVLSPRADRVSHSYLVLCVTLVHRRPGAKPIVRILGRWSRSHCRAAAPWSLRDHHHAREHTGPRQRAASRLD